MGRGGGRENNQRAAEEKSGSRGKKLGGKEIRECVGEYWMQIAVAITLLRVHASKSECRVVASAENQDPIHPRRMRRALGNQPAIASRFSVEAQVELQNNSLCLNEGTCEQIQAFQSTGV
eukprot:6190747-Pleurochrysis_carterae.AAC.4